LFYHLGKIQTQHIILHIQINILNKRNSQT
jgi:hypothetical protein